jgi:hypothetical protein
MGVGKILNNRIIIQTVKIFQKLTNISNHEFKQFVYLDLQKISTIKQIEKNDE